MKSILLSCICLLGTGLFAQTYTPIAVTGYNQDAIAETSPALNSTSASIDGSGYVLYSHAFGVGAGTSYGVPDNGSITSGTKSYQMNSFTANNTLYIPAGLKDSLTITTPASYAGISLLGFATEGACTMSVTMRYTDGTTEVFGNTALPDWFNNSGYVITGLDRVGRTNNTVDFLSTNPRMYPINFNLACANRTKSLMRIIIQNTATNPRVCIFGVSGAALPTYSINTTNAACYGSNGTASVVVTGGLPAFTYTWTSSPVQNTASANVPAGTYSVTVKDAGGCIATLSTTVTQPAVVTTTISVSTAPLCTGVAATLTTSGANTYTWSNSGSTATTVITPTASGTYSVAGTTAAGCVITASINLTVNASPVISFSLPQTTFCSGASNITLNATPAGGTYSGSGVTGTTYSPGAAGVGTHTMSYAYTNASNCKTTSVLSTTVIPSTAVSFSLMATSFCLNSPSINLEAVPSTGIYSGDGVTGTNFNPTTAGVGTHTVTYTYGAANGCVTTVALTNTVNTCTGIEELETVSMNLYPNPNNGVFTLQLTTDMQITVMNETGQILTAMSLKAGENTLTLKNLPAGIYMITGQNSQQIMKQKIMMTN